jgi:SulP family sulfate permease
LIAIVMTVYGMNAAMIAGGISAVSTYAVQTVAYLHPIRGQMTGVTLRSSKRNRHHKANAILEESDIGRSRILVIQLQGHLFFGNMAQLNESIGECMSSKYGTDNQPWIVILDFSLVLGIDSSAAQALIKIKKLLKKRFDVRLSIFVTGSTDGFPCDYNLSAELMGPKDRVDIDIETKLTQAASLSDFSNEETALLAQGPITECEKYNYEGCQVCQSLDLALVVAENALIFKQDPSLLGELIDISRHDYLSEDQEKELGLKYLKIICPEHVEDEDIEILFSLFQRQTYRKDELLWAQASPGDCAMLLLKGSLLASLENEAGTNETVQEGRMVGELGLVQGSARMSSLRCVSQEAIVYRLSIEDFEDLIQSNPSVARLMDQICISYLADRVQHVSNRIFETRCLPI